MIVRSRHRCVGRLPYEYLIIMPRLLQRLMPVFRLIGHASQNSRPRSTLGLTDSSGMSLVQQYRGNGGGSRKLFSLFGG